MPHCVAPEILQSLAGFGGPLTYLLSSSYLYTNFVLAETGEAKGLSNIALALALA